MNFKEEDTIITLKIAKHEVNTIIEGLGGLPFKEVYKLIEKIHLQAKANEKMKSLED
ncbi:hypothetical protein N9242_03475 [Vicingaceae bacterium]|nr:hypothetical protein [Vicingaceae bacterium]